MPQFGNVSLGCILARDGSDVFMGLSAVHFAVTSRLLVQSTTRFIGLLPNISGECSTWPCPTKTQNVN